MSRDQCLKRMVKIGRGKAVWIEVRFNTTSFEVKVRKRESGALRSEV